MYISYDELPKLDLPYSQEVLISDSTLRDGSQMPGIVISADDRVKIFEYLHRVGIEKLELFLFSKSDKDAASRMLDYGFEFPEVTGWARSNTGDIDLVLGMDGIEETGILMSVSNAHILTKMGLPSKESARKKYLDSRSDREIRAYAEKYFMFNPLISKVTRRMDERHHARPDSSGEGG